MILMIAVIKEIYEKKTGLFSRFSNNKKEDKILGFRLLNTATKEVTEQMYASVLNALTNRKIKIDNLRLVNGEIKGCNGSLDRYAVLNQQLQPISKSPLMVISKNGGQLLCANCQGKITQVGEKDAIFYADECGIANGKIVNGRISAIEGNYSNEGLDMRNAQQKIVDAYQLYCKTHGKPHIDFHIEKGIITISTVDPEATYVELPKFASRLGLDAFYHSKIKSLVIPGNIKEVVQSAISDCNDLEEIIVENGVKTIGRNAFHGCEALKKITIADSVTEIGWHALFACVNLESIKMPKGLKKLEEVLVYCRKLKQVELPEGIVEISDGAFSGCYELVTVNLPNTITKIGEGAFKECKKLERIVMPSGIKEIAQGMFTDCDSLKEVVMQPGLEVIRRAAFYSCDELIKADIPDSVREIGSRAFFNCKKLQTVLPPRLEILGEQAFSQNRAMTHIEFPSTLREVGESVIAYNSNLEKVEINCDAGLIKQETYKGCHKINEKNEDRYDVGETRPRTVRVTKERKEGVE